MRRKSCLFPAKFAVNNWCWKFYNSFEGKLTTSKWAKINKCSTDTALRDIQDLVVKGILVRTDAGGRSTGYKLVK